MKPRIAVAYSGGRDSTALLHATLAAASEQGVEVAALHVHHGLSVHADAWLSHCELQCRRWAQRGRPVVFAVERLDAGPAKGESVEAWARRARYRALRQMALAQGADMVLLAHHRRDQAETFLLQALRAAGVAGLSGMPREIVREGITWARPWLDVPRERVEAYLRRHRLRYIDDDSNENVRFARNRIRHRVWPALIEAFPTAEATLASAAEWAQEASACLAELADIDLAAVAREGMLDLHVWRGLSAARQSNALRAWLKRTTGQAADAALVSRLLVELRDDGAAQWALEAGRLARYRGRLSYRAHSTTHMPVTMGGVPESEIQVKRAGRYALPGWGGCLVVQRVSEGGVPFELLGRLELRPREGGEQFQAGPGRPARSLKKQFQAKGVPAWERDGPLVYSGGRLVFVPGLGIDARVVAERGEPQAALWWMAD